MRSRRWPERFMLAYAVLHVNLAMSLSFPTLAAASNPLVLVPPDGRFFGRTYSDLSEEWIKWAFATNFAAALDPDGSA